MTHTDAHTWDMDAAWDWTGPADPDVLEMQTRLASQPDDPWLSRCHWTADAWDTTRNEDRR